MTALKNRQLHLENSRGTSSSHKTRDAYIPDKSKLLNDTVEPV